MDSLWWAVWWRWFLLWALTLISVIVAVTVFVHRWRQHRKDSKGHPTPGISFYLHNESVMDLYLRGGYKAALRQEVEEKIVSSKDATISAEFSGVGGKAGKRVDREIFRKYIKIEEAITVIKIVMDVLESANDVVWVDLLAGSVDQGVALAVRGTTNSTLSLSQLSDLEVFVSVRGRFKMTFNGGRTVTFAAPCGVRKPSSQALVTCVRSGFRRQVPDRRFVARCIGRIQDWDTDTRELVIDPIAIFQ